MFNITYGNAIIIKGDSEMYSAGNVTSCASLLRIHDYHIYILYELANSLIVASVSLFRDTKLF